MLKLAGLVHVRPDGLSPHYSARGERTAPLTAWLKAYGVFHGDEMTVEIRSNRFDDDANQRSPATRCSMRRTAISGPVS